MTYEEAKTKPLNELLGYLTAIDEDCCCACACKPETWSKEFNDPIVDAEMRKIVCQKLGKYGNCPQRIAYERVMKAYEKATKKKPNIEKKSYYSVFKCPSCNTKLISKFKDGSYIGKKGRYCYVCGQRLDWSSRK